MKIYVASSWRNEYQPGIVRAVRQAGHEVYDFRNPGPGNAGFGWEQLDERWQDWTPFQYRRALNHPIAVDGYLSDMNALDNADLVILLLPSGRSSHIEAAYHRGKGGPVIIHMPEPCEPELMYKMFNAITTTQAELMDLLRTPLEAFRSILLHV